MKFIRDEQQPHDQDTRSVLIIGIDGQIGSALFKSFSQLNYYKTYGTTRRLNISLNTNEIFQLDLLKNSSSKIFGHFDHIVFCAGISNIAFCNAKPTLCKKINFDNTSKLIKKFSQLGSHVLFLSSNAVFNGDKSFHRITETPDPTTYYGQLKLDIENEFKLDSNFASLRLTKVISPSTPFIMKWHEELSKNQSIDVFDNRFISPIKIEKVIDCIHLILSNRAHGIFHLGGDSEISYAEFARVYFSSNPEALKLIKIKTDLSLKDMTVHNSLTTHLPFLIDKPN